MRREADLIQFFILRCAWGQVCVEGEEMREIGEQDNARWEVWRTFLFFLLSSISSHSSLTPSLPAMHRLLLHTFQNPYTISFVFKTALQIYENTRFFAFCLFCFLRYAILEQLCCSRLKVFPPSVNLIKTSLLFIKVLRILQLFASVPLQSSRQRPLQKSYCIILILKTRSAK